jgi:DNA-binding transcriptional MerR regulator
MTDYLSISRAAALLGVHPATLRRWEQAGRVTPRRINLGYSTEQVDLMPS